MSDFDKEIDEFMINKNEVKAIEKFYVDGQIDNLEEIVNERKDKLEEKMKEFIEKHTKMEEKDGEFFPILKANPYVISMYFFKSINPINNLEPKYSPEKLGIVWELYKYLVYRVNEEIDTFSPTVSGFCQFAGISTTTFRRYKASSEEPMRNVINKIEDLCYDTSVTFAQKGKLKERMTIYRMKSEQDKIEKEQPVIHIHNEPVNKNRIKKRIQELKKYNRYSAGEEDEDNE